MFIIREHITKRIFSTYHPTVCYVCLKRAVDCELKKCSGCKLVLYCSRDHQKVHWPEHRHLCKVAQTFANRSNNLSIFDTNFNNYHEFLCYRNILLKCIATEMKRPLTPMEQQIINIPYCCNTCYRSKPNMITCPNCCALAWCSDEHRQQNLPVHNRACDKLRLCLYSDITDQEGYYLHCKIKDSSSNFPECMDKFMYDYAVVTTQPSEALKYGVFNVSNNFSFVLSAYHAIRQARPTLLTYSKELTIHVVGPGDAEKVSFKYWEYLFHLCKKLKTLNLFYIGPGLSNEDAVMDLCPDCDRRKREFNFKTSTLLYHDYVTSECKKPDLIVAFNCGFHEFHPVAEDFTWKESIPVFFKNKGVVIAFTSYTWSEAQLDYDFVKANCKRTDLNSIIEYEKNLYKSVKPMRDWNNVDETDCVFYFNNYISVLMS